jgi:hypothetical protein
MARSILDSLKKRRVIGPTIRIARLAPLRHRPASVEAAQLRADIVEAYAGLVLRGWAHSKAVTQVSKAARKSERYVYAVLKERTLQREN